jgi:dihydropteroate synthase
VGWQRARREKGRVSPPRPTAERWHCSPVAHPKGPCYGKGVTPLDVLLDRIRARRAVVLMGVLNVTPDSFSDGGAYLAPAEARQRIDQMLEEGAEMIDIGGESTRPRAVAVPAPVQIERIRAPLAYAVNERRALVSVDTTSPEVARFALDHGARLINDVSCLGDLELARVTAQAGAGLIIMHARGAMAAMEGFSSTPESAYTDVVSEVRSEWLAARERAMSVGMPRDHVLLDPGFGYMKSARHSLELVRRLGELASLGAPIVAGPSRKSFLSRVSLPAEPALRLGATIAACLACVERGASVLRVHDVLAVRQAVLFHAAVADGAPHA